MPNVLFGIIIQTRTGKKHPPRAILACLRIIMKKNPTRKPDSSFMYSKKMLIHAKAIRKSLCAFYPHHPMCTFGS